MTDWQDAAFSNRHLHNRVGKQGRGKGGRSGGHFDVHKTFGTYELKCPAAAKLQTTNSEDVSVAKLEIYTLNSSGNALFGELFLPGVLHANVLLAGSRKVMNSVVRDLVVEGEDEVQDDGGQGEQIESGPHSNDEEVDEDETDEEEAEARRVREFEKNSFRSPKFWLSWQGEVMQTAPLDGDGQKLITDAGYLVFSGNACDKFQGTLSCESLGWDNVKISGWKTASRSARDFAFEWIDE